MGCDHSRLSLGPEGQQQCQTESGRNSEDSLGATPHFSGISGNADCVHTLARFHAFFILGILQEWDPSSLTSQSEYL